MSFLTEELPKEKKFLLKYFKGESQEKFLRYLILITKLDPRLTHFHIKCFI